MDLSKVLVCNNLRHSPCYIRNIAQLTIKMYSPKFGLSKD